MNPSIETIRNAIECALPSDAPCYYLSHPVTSGSRPMAENIESSAAIATAIRAKISVPLVNPTGIGHIEGWGHDEWMKLWLPFIRERVSVMIMAPGWTESPGCNMEADEASAMNIRIVCVDAVSRGGMSIVERARRMADALDDMYPGLGDVAIEGHTPSEPDEPMRPPTAQEVSLMQYENMQLKERVAELESLNGFIQAQKIAEMLGLRVGSQLVESARDKIEKLNKVHSAACRHLEAMGACDDTGDHDDESHAEVFGCTYCNLDRAASAVDEKS